MDNMNKYRKAFEFYQALVAESADPEEGQTIWWKFRDGILAVARYDNEISVEEFEEILKWR